VTLIFLAAVVVHLVRPSDAWVAVAFIGVLAGAALVAWITSFRTPPPRRVPATLVAAGLTSNVLGEVVWYTSIVGSESTDASLADVGWLVSYVFLAAALWLSLAQSRDGDRFDLDSVIDALTIVVVSVLTLWNFSVAAIAGDPSLTPLVKFVWATYPIADAILIALVVRIVTDRRARASIDPWFGVGVAAWLVADLGFLTLPLTDLHEAWENAGWMLGAILMARFHRGGRAVPPEQTEGNRTLGKLAIAIGPLLAVPVLAIVDLVTGRPVQSWALTVGALVLLVLAVVRTARLLQSEQRAIRELSAARDAALEASRAKSDFLATMSHEIRTPMNGVLGLSDLLLRTELTDRQRQYAEGVRGAGHDLLDLINDILDFSRVESGRVDLESVEMDLEAVVEDAVQLVSGAAHDKGLELVTACDPRLPTAVLGDPNRLRQVLLNIVSNAVKFTASGDVVVRAAPVTGGDGRAWVRFEVSDTGIGLPDGDPDWLFDAFSQGDSSTTRTYGGTGLGLAICRELVTLMGGRIGVTPRAGGGSTFWFTVPFGEATGVDRPPQPAVSGLRVLLVDDNAAFRELVGGRLGYWGVRVDPVADAAAGLESLTAAAVPYDAIVLDGSLPGPGTTELVREVTAAGGPRPGLVVLTSGEGVEAIVTAAADACLAKPVRASALRSAVAGAAATGRAEPAARPLVRVLVVDERPVSQMITGGMVEHLGYEVEVAADEAEALGALAHQRFDVVLVDCPSPEAGGCTVARAIRRQESGGERRTPVVALTPAEPALGPDWRDAVGVDGQLERPVSLQALSEELEHWADPDPALLTRTVEIGEAEAWPLRKQRDPEAGRAPAT
jgi:signal transduction histidine kinase/DNA-binding response OmpR family regulator